MLPPFSIKYCQNLLKVPDQSPSFSKNDRKNGVSRAIYELIANGIKGDIKKESVLQTLSDISVSIYVN